MMGFVGALPYFNDAVAGTKQTVKDAPAKLYGVKLVNTTAAAAYLQVFDKLAANVTVGTTTPTFCFRLAANESVNIQFEAPIDFQNGMTLAGCTSATNSTGAAISVLALYQ
jgi:hypothetical protein